MPRVVRILLGVLAAVLVLAAIGLLVATHTDFGRERIRRLAVDVLNDNLAGIVRVGGLDGTVLGGPLTLSDVSITDSAGEPFVSADRISVSYGLGALLKKRIVINSLQLVRPVIVLDQPPGGRWNWERIFALDTTTSVDTTLGFGDWILLRNVSLNDARVVVRTPWQPDSSLAPAARDSAIAIALSNQSRLRVERVPDGFQQVMDFRSIDGSFPRIRLADPDSSERIVQVATLNMIAEPFRPPAADVRDLVGTIVMADDSLWWRELRVHLPNTRLLASGAYLIEPGDMHMRSRVGPMALADLRWLYPHVPEEGGGSLEFAFARRGDTVDFVARNAALRVGEAELHGQLGMTLADTMTLRDTDFRFTNLDTRLIEQLVPGLELPRRGTLGGRATLDGTPGAMRLDADVTFNDTRSGTSRITARGLVGVVGSAFLAEDLRLRADPIQVDLARIAVRKLPVGGTITGTAALNGSSETRLRATADLVHRDRRTRSRLFGGGMMEMTGRRRVDIELRAEPLSLTTAGRFAPGAGLRGSALGRVQVTGVMRDLALHGHFRLPDGGTLTTRGRFDLASAEKRYDLATSLRVFNLRSVVARGPQTSLTAVATARGRGLEPKTMRAVLAADVSRSLVDSVAFDSVHARAAIASGVVTIDSLSLRTPFARVGANGTFGLTAARQGALVYRVQIDSLAALRRYIPGLDTGVVRARPAHVAAALARAREDSARIAQAREIERVIKGAPPPQLEADTGALTIARDSLAGSLYAAGIVRGNTSRFDLRGRAAVFGVVARGNAVNRGRADYAWLAARTPSETLSVALTVDSVRAGGFLLDSADVSVRYGKNAGMAVVAIHQDTAREYRARAEFALDIDQSEVRFDDVLLRFPATRWESIRPGALRWGKRGIEIETLDLRNRAGGRIFADGRLPATGPIDLQVNVHGVEIGDVLSLLQSDVDARGVVVLAARLEGTQRSPRLRGAAGVTRLSYRGTPVPDLRATFGYEDELLALRAQALRVTRQPLMTTTATVPVNLALAEYSGPRLLAEQPLVVDVRGDSIPLDALPKFTDAVSEVRGRLAGRIAVRGTAKEPSVAGDVALDFASFHIVPQGITVRDIFGFVRMRGDTVVIDSLVGRSGGPLRISGGLDVVTPAQPGFDLRLRAREALVIDNDYGRLHSDADIALRGPYTRLSVTGSATILRGVIYVPEPETRSVISTSDPAVFNVIDTAVVAEDTVAPSQNPLLDSLKIDMKLRVLRDTWVRSAEANVEIFSDSIIRVDIDRRRGVVLLDGVLSTERGEYTFMGRRFRLTRGAATFTGTTELNPLLQFTGETEARVPGREALALRVLIGGTLQQPRVTLESDAQPPLSQTDLLTMLAFGRSSSSLLEGEGSSSLSGSTGGSGLVGNVAALATRQMTSVALGAVVDDAETRLGRRLGIDVLNIAPAPLPADIFNPNVGTILRGTELEGGKYLTPDVFVAFQGRPTFDAAPGFRIEYRMPKGYRIETSLEPRYLLRAPSLKLDQPTRSTNEFGSFLIREWRF